MTGYLSSWNDGAAKSGTLEFVWPVTEAKPGSCCRLIGLRRLKRREDVVREADLPADRFPGHARAVNVRDDFKVVFDL